MIEYEASHYIQSTPPLPHASHATALLSTIFNTKKRRDKHSRGTRSATKKKIGAIDARARYDPSQASESQQRRQQRHILLHTRLLERFPRRKVGIRVFGPQSLAASDTDISAASSKLRRKRRGHRRLLLRKKMGDTAHLLFRTSRWSCSLTLQVRIDISPTALTFVARSGQDCGPNAWVESMPG